jgi:DNA-binding response OmpR family regulator
LGRDSTDKKTMSSVVGGSGSARGRVLVVDDDLDICGLIAFKLGSLGYSVLLEHDGDAGLAAARLEHPDLIVLDWMMPRLTGLEVCAEIRTDPKLRETPVILLTAKAQEADIARAFAAGVSDYLVKPFSPRELAQRIESLLARTVV